MSSRVTDCITGTATLVGPYKVGVLALSHKGGNIVRRPVAFAKRSGGPAVDNRGAQHLKDNRPFQRSTVLPVKNGVLWMR